MKTVGVQKGIGQSFDTNIARVSKNSKGGVDDYSIRTQASWSHEWTQILKDSQISKVLNSSHEITNGSCMSSNYENIVKTTTTDSLNNNLYNIASKFV